MRFKMPKLVFAVDNGFYRPMWLNDNNSLVSTNFDYSPLYTMAGFDYIDEFFTAIDGVTYARVLFINNLDAPQYLTPQLYYYKLAEVIQYPAIPNLVVTPVHENIAITPWILQNWILAKDNERRLQMEQWHNIQIFMAQQYQTELAAYNAYCAAKEIATTKRKLQKVKYELRKLKSQVTANVVARKDATVTTAPPDTTTTDTAVKLKPQSKSKKATPPTATIIRKAQKQQPRRDDILLRVSEISALATMPSHTYEKILNLLKPLVLDEPERNLFNANLVISIQACVYIIHKLRSRTDINITVKRAFLYKLTNYSKDTLFDYAKYTPTQNFVTMAFEQSEDAQLQGKIQNWHFEMEKLKAPHNNLFNSLKEHFAMQQDEPTSRLAQAILNLDADKFAATIKNNPSLNEQSISLLKKYLPELTSANVVQLEKFLADIKITKDVWRDIYVDPNTSGSVKLAAQQWATAEAQELFNSIERKTKPVKIPACLLPLLNNKTNASKQTLLMLAVSKTYPDNQLEQIITHAANNILTVSADNRTILHYVAKYYTSNNYELTKKICNLFVEEAITTGQHLSELIHKQSDIAGGTWLHCLLSGDNEDHACEIIRTLFTDSSLSPELKQIFRSTMFVKNQYGRNAAQMLDIKETEWSSVRKLLYSFIPEAAMRYEFPPDYGYFLWMASAAPLYLSEIVNQDPLRLIDILDQRANLHFDMIAKMNSILKTTPTKLLNTEQQRLNSIIEHFGFCSQENSMIKETGINIHSTLAHRICNTSDKTLEKKYLNSIFYKNYKDIRFQDRLLWHKFIHNYIVWAMLDYPINSQASDATNAAIRDILKFLSLNHNKIYEMLECLFNSNETQQAFTLLFRTCKIHNVNILPMMYAEFFKFYKHHKFAMLIQDFATNFRAQELGIFAMQVVEFALQQQPIKLDLISILLYYCEKDDVVFALMDKVGRSNRDYDAFIATALDNAGNNIIFNLLCKRGHDISCSTMAAMCRIATQRNNFEPIYTVLQLAKNLETGNWDPKASIYQYLFAYATKTNNITIVETVISRFRPRITLDILTTVFDNLSASDIDEDSIGAKIATLISAEESRQQKEDECEQNQRKLAKNPAPTVTRQPNKILAKPKKLSLT